MESKRPIQDILGIQICIGDNWINSLDLHPLDREITRTSVPDDAMFNVIREALYRFRETRPRIIASLARLFAKEPLTINFYSRSESLYGKAGVSSLEIRPSGKYLGRVDLGVKERCVADMLADRRQQLMAILIHELGHILQNNIRRQQQILIAPVCAEIPKTSSASALPFFEGGPPQPGELWCEGLACEVMLPPHTHPYQLRSRLDFAEKAMLNALDKEINPD